METTPVLGELQQLLTSSGVSAVTDSIRDYALFLIDPQGTILTWNTGAQRLKGYTAREIIGQNISRFYTPEAQASGRPQTLLRTAARDGRVEDEGWRVRKDGTRFWADVVISAIPDNAGGVRGFVKVTRDLTDRRRTEEELRQSEERLRQMIGSVRDYAIYMLDTSGHITSWNSGAAALKGYTASEILGEHVSRFYVPEDAHGGKAEHELEVATRTGRFEEEGWRVRKDGSRFWANVVISAVRNAEGKLIGFTKVTRDMTERKRAHEATLERVRQQSAVSELGLFALATPELEQVREETLRTIRETLGRDDVRLLHPNEARPAGALTASIRVPGPGGSLIPQGELAVMDAHSPSDNDRTFLQSVANILAAAIGRAQVESELRAAERRAVEEREKTLQANEALRSRDEFISVAAHELRTPLTALQLKLQSLGRKLPAADDTQRLEGALRQTERLARLVDRLLDVSRVAHERLEMNREEFDFVPLVRQVAEDFREPAAQARSPLELDLPESATGSWDRLRMEQVLVNLLSNAVKYGAGKPVSVKLETEADRLRLAIADQGIGISAEDVGRLFGRFQRAAPIRHYGGMGLGLYITRHIVEAHGGTITVASKPAVGSTFLVEIPRSPVVSLTPPESAFA